MTEDTKQEQTEPALKAADAKYRSIFERSVGGIHQSTPAGRFLSVNPAMARMFDYETPEEMICDCQDIARQAYAEPARRLEFQRLLESKGVIHGFEYEARRKDGSTVWVSENARVVRDEHGRVLHYEGILEDITARRQAEQAMRESEIRFRSLAEISPAGILIHQGGPYLYVNAVFQALTGYSRDELLAMNFWEVVHPDYQALVRERGVKRRQGDETPIEYEIKIVTKQGAERWGVIRATRFEFEGRPAVLATLFDITERKRAEQALTEAHAQLGSRAVHLENLIQERTASLREMVNELQHVSYAIAHDMRAPLRAMNTFANVVLEQVSASPVAPQVHDYCHRIITAAGRLDKLIQDALHYTKSVLQEVPLQPVDLSKLIPSLVETYPNLQPERADIIIADPLPVVLGEESLLTQCFSNLLGNAVKFVANGNRPQIQIRTVLSGSFARITIEDNGIGIPLQAQPRLFGMFQRLNHDFEGTGIGLAIVRKVVERMGGKVGAESEPGKGSRFWLELQLALTERPALQALTP
jgi:PAS domain S-box-containing protein